MQWIKDSKTYSINYKKAGVDIELANLFVRKIKLLTNSIRKKEVIFDIGPFAGGYSLEKIKKYKAPVLFASCDGVGTKIKLISLTKKYEIAGIDLVAMNVNDIITTGAEPLIFMDYLAMGKLDLNIGERIIKGIIKGCKEAGTFLLGGETAELPSFYKRGEFELAGFVIGISDKSEIIDGKNIRKGDLILGLASNGLHANGFSLVRKIFKKKEILNNWGKYLVKPTKIYVNEIRALKKKINIKAIAHITGGGFYDNIERILPNNYRAEIIKKNWNVPSIFKEIRKRAKISDEEMFRTFNMGIGMVIIIEEKYDKLAKRILDSNKCKSYQIGIINKGEKGVVIR
jgi:phosphoribosylformylglycinamidine cyclo-ligase